MTAPASRARFEFTVELYLGVVLGWVDITADVRGQVAITRGQSSEGGRANPGTCALRLDNSSGDYSPRNPAGQWYGYLGRNTPLRVTAGPAGGTLVTRFRGEVSEWPARWSLDEVDRYADVTAAGVLRRLGQGEQPSYSPLRRTIDGTDPLAYWPLEDGSDTGQGGSAVSGVPALTVTGTAPFDDIDSWVAANGYDVVYGTAALVDLSQGGSLSGSLPASVTAATATGWTIVVCSDVTVGVALSANLVLVEVDTPGGSFVRWQLVITTSGRTQLIAYDSAGAATTVIDYPSVQTSMIPHTVALWQSGGTIQAGYLWDGGSYFAAGSTAGTLAGLTAIRVNPTSTTATVTMPTGHLTVLAGHDLDVTSYYDGDIMLALFGWEWTGIGTASAAVTGEAADERLVRVWADEGVIVTVPTAEADPIMLGRQPAGTLTDLTDQSVNADGGYLFEARDSINLVYRTRASLYNQTPTPIAYNGQLSAPFDPVDDADQVRNDVTAKRPDGSSARYVQTEGRLAAVTPPDGVGVYRTEVELHLVDDTGLLDQAAWRVHLGTVDRPRYPALSVQLAAPGWDADPAGLAALLAVDTGDVLEVTGLPSWAAGDARTLVTGYSETFDEWTWTITFSGVPAQPWDVAEVAGEARVGSDGSTLAADLTGAALTPAGSWDFTSGLESWVALGGSAAHDSAAGAGVFTPSGAASSLEARAPNVAAVAGQVYAFIADVEVPEDASLSAYLLWRDAALSLLSTTSVTVSVLAGRRRRVAVVGTAPASTAFVMCMVGLGGTPPATRTITVYKAALSVPQTMSLASTTVNGVWTTDSSDMPLDVRVGEERLTVASISGTSSPQTAQVAARAVNNIQAAWPAGTEVDLRLPAVASL